MVELVLVVSSVSASLLCITSRAVDAPVLHMRSKPSALVVLVDADFLQGSIVSAAFVGMQILDIHLCVTVSISDMKPRSISTAPNQKEEEHNNDSAEIVSA